jgi:plasmid replication initiation protein
MYARINLYRNCGLNIKESIIHYQEKTGMSEEYWPMESIKKDYYRKAPKESFDFMEELIVKIDQLFVGTLSRKKDNMPFQKTLL